MTGTMREMPVGHASDERRALVMAAVFMLAFLALEVGAAVLSVTGVVYPVAKSIASATGWFANITGVAATVSQAQVFIGDRILVINAECTGIYLAAAYVALVLASPRTWHARVVAILVGVLAVAAANMLRLSAIVHITDRAPRALPFLHDYLFQVLLVGVVLGVWALWLGRTSTPHAT